MLETFIDVLDRMQINQLKIKGTKTFLLIDIVDWNSNGNVCVWDK